jgi:hypothetical protein
VIVLGVSPLVISEIAVLFDIDLRGSHKRISRLGCVSMNPDWCHTWQLLIHRKMLNLK